MSRLRRLQLTERIFFITCNVLRRRRNFEDCDFEALASAMDTVCARRGFRLAGYTLMPDHWHALIVPARGDSIDRTMNAVKVAAAHGINRLRGTSGSLWHLRYFDRVMRTVREFHETIDYMHLNPVRAGLVRDPGKWAWSSFHCFGGPGPIRLQVDDLNLPSDEKTYL